MEIKTLPISQIKTNPKNPRIIKDEKFKQLVKSIKDFPQMLTIRPIVIDENNIVLGGNMRLRACQEAGLKEVATIKADQLTEDQKKEFIIKDNIGFGEWDWSMLANEWCDEKLAEWGLDIPSFADSIPEPEDNSLGGEDFNIKVECNSGREQKILFDKLTEEGYKCHI